MLKAFCIYLCPMVLVRLGYLSVCFPLIEDFGIEAYSVLLMKVFNVNPLAIVAIIFGLLFGLHSNVAAAVAASPMVKCTDK